MGADRGSFEAKVLVAAPVAVSWLTPLVAVPDAARRLVTGLELGNQPHPERYDPATRTAAITKTMSSFPSLNGRPSPSSSAHFGDDGTV
jgi:hypothetical protein